MFVNFKNEILLYIGKLQGMGYFVKENVPDSIRYYPQNNKIYEE